MCFKYYGFSHVNWFWNDVEILKFYLFAKISAEIVTLWVNLSFKTLKQESRHFFNVFHQNFNFTLGDA